tara:strand:+ start:431 stop:601 length:171 start_codon:yes stop_codon:yes gene_type:complete
MSENVKEIVKKITDEVEDDQLGFTKSSNPTVYLDKLSTKELKELEEKLEEILKEDK